MINSPFAAWSVVDSRATVDPHARRRAAMTRNADYITRAPKGVFIYLSHEEMQRDRLRWQVEAIVQKAKER